MVFVWLKSGSRVYVDRIMRKLPVDRVHLGNPIQAAKVDDSTGRRQVLLQTNDGHWETFDHAIFACHSDATLEILRRGGNILPDEEHLLSKFQWNKNGAVLHTDNRVQ